MHQGSCHCGQTRFTLAADALGPVAECNCSHCQRKGYLLWFVPRDALKFESGEDALATYTFNKHVVRHRFCPTCGIHPFGEGVGPDGTAMAAINLRCIEGIDLEAVPVTHYDGRAR